MSSASGKVLLSQMGHHTYKAQKKNCYGIIGIQQKCPDE